MGANRLVVGGYPIDGVVNEGDWLWFTGAKWTPIPYGTQGSIVTLISPPFVDVPFISNGYIVSVENLQSGDVLCAVRTLTTDWNKTFEYITNIPYNNIDNRLQAGDMGTSFYANNSADGGQENANLSASSMGNSYSTIVS